MTEDREDPIMMQVIAVPVFLIMQENRGHLVAGAQYGPYDATTVLNLVKRTRAPGRVNGEDDYYFKFPEFDDPIMSITDIGIRHDAALQQRIETWCRRQPADECPEHDARILQGLEDLENLWALQSIVRIANGAPYSGFGFVDRHTFRVMTTPVKVQTLQPVRVERIHDVTTIIPFINENPVTGERQYIDPWLSPDHVFLLTDVEFVIDRELEAAIGVWVQNNGLLPVSQQARRMAADTALEELRRMNVVVADPRQQGNPTPQPGTPVIDYTTMEPPSVPLALEYSKSFEWAIMGWQENNFGDPQRSTLRLNPSSLVKALQVHYSTRIRNGHSTFLFAYQDGYTREYIKLVDVTILVDADLQRRVDLWCRLNPARCPEHEENKTREMNVLNNLLELQSFLSELPEDDRQEYDELVDLVTFSVMRVPVKIRLELQRVVTLVLDAKTIMDNSRVTDQGLVLNITLPTLMNVEGRVTNPERMITPDHIQEWERTVGEAFNRVARKRESEEAWDRLAELLHLAPRGRPAPLPAAPGVTPLPAAPAGPPLPAAPVVTPLVEMNGIELVDQETVTALRAWEKLEAGERDDDDPVQGQLLRWEREKQLAMNAVSFVVTNLGDKRAPRGTDWFLQGNTGNGVFCVVDGLIPPTPDSQLFFKFTLKRHEWENTTDFLSRDNVIGHIFAVVLGGTPEYNSCTVYRGSFATPVKVFGRNPGTRIQNMVVEWNPSEACSVRADNALDLNRTEMGERWMLMNCAVSGAIAGNSLGNLLTSGHFGTLRQRMLPEFIRWLAYVGRRFGFRHNDLHDDNVMLDNDRGCLVLIDYGRSYFGGLDAGVNTQATEFLRRDLRKYGVNDIDNLTYSDYYSQQRGFKGYTEGGGNAWLADFAVLANCIYRRTRGNRDIVGLRDSMDAIMSWLPEQGQFRMAGDPKQLIDVFEAKCAGERDECMMWLYEGLLFLRLMMHKSVLLHGRGGVRTFGHDQLQNCGIYWTGVFLDTCRFRVNVLATHCLNFAIEAMRSYTVDFPRSRVSQGVVLGGALERWRAPVQGGSGEGEPDLATVERIDLTKLWVKNAREKAVRDEYQRQLLISCPRSAQA
jgi:hypothetical protein